MWRLSTTVLLVLAASGGLSSQQTDPPRAIFERNQTSNARGNSQCRLTEENGTILEVMQRGGSCVFYAGLTGKVDLEFTIVAKVLAGPNNFGYGLIFSRTADVEASSAAATYFQFVVTANGYYRLRFWDGSRDITVIDWTRHAAVKTGYSVENVLRAVTDGVVIRLFVNNQYVGGHVAKSGLIGGVGYLVEEFGMRAQFSSLSASRPSSSIKDGPTPGRVRLTDDLVTGRKFQEGGALVCRAAYDPEGYLVENVSPLSGMCDLPLAAAGSFGSNVTVSVWAKLRQGPMDHSYGLYVGRENALSKPLILGAIDGQGTFQITQRTTGWQRLTRLLVHDEIRQGLDVWNRITLEIRGQTIRGYVNGTPTGHANVESMIAGMIGVYVDYPKMVAVFRDLSVVEN